MAVIIMFKIGEVRKECGLRGERPGKRALGSCLEGTTLSNRAHGQAGGLAMSPDYGIRMA